MRFPIPGRFAPAIVSMVIPQQRQLDSVQCQYDVRLSQQEVGTAEY